MSERINPLEILEYEREVDSYIQYVYSKKKENPPSIDYNLESAIDFIETRAKFYSNIITKELLALQEEHISYFASLDKRLKQRDRII